MSSSKQQDFPLLLEVFRDGLMHGVLSKDEIVAWADGVIAAENEPEYFLIEVSLGHDKNDLITTLNANVTDSENPIVSRVVMGLIYRKLIDDNETMTVEEAAAFAGKLRSDESLTSFESNKLYAFEDYEFYYLPDDTQLQVDIINFLSIYEDFNLANYEQWPQINIRVEEILIEEQRQADIVSESLRKSWEKREAKRKLKKYTVFSILLAVLLFIIILNFKLMQDEPTVSKLFEDHEYIFFLDFFVFYSTVRVAFKIWAKRRRMR